MSQTANTKYKWPPYDPEPKPPPWKFSAYATAYHTYCSHCSVDLCYWTSVHVVLCKKKYGCTRKKL